jgi:hypothetical protein
MEQSLKPMSTEDIYGAIQTLKRQLEELQDIEAIRRLIDHYTALHDQAFYDLKARQQWEDLFASDAHVKYAFGEHKGREGLGEWAWGPAVSYYEQCHLQSSNFDISFSDDQHQQLSFVRSNCITHWLPKLDSLHKHFDVGGVYHWTIRRTTGGKKWEIWKLDLDVAWTSGRDFAGVSGSQESEITA